MGDRRELRITIEFYSDGRTVANMWKHRLGGGMVGALRLKHGEAKCHPDDKFDPQVGAMIALARMFGDEVEFKVDDEEPLTKNTEREEPLTKNEMMAKDCGYRLMRYGFPKEDGKYRVITGYLTISPSFFTLYYNAEHKVFYSDATEIDLSDEKSIERYRDYWCNIIAWKRMK